MLVAGVEEAVDLVEVRGEAEWVVVAEVEVEVSISLLYRLSTSEFHCCSGPNSKLG
jgi:hypothetical protein